MIMTRKYLLKSVVALLSVIRTASFTIHQPKLVPSRGSLRAGGFDLGPGDDGPARGSSKAVLDKIDGLVNEAPIVLFMKGTPLFPQCGFSNTMVQILDRMGLKYNAHNVLDDDSGFVQTPP